jgi:hypothetical protein
MLCRQRHNPGEHKGSQPPMPRKSYLPVRVLDYRLDAAAKSAATAIRDRGGSAATQFIRRLGVHLDEAEMPRGLDDADLRAVARRQARRSRPS